MDNRMLRGFRYFLPREERFFDLFARHAQTVAQGALALQGMLRGGEETPVFCQRVNQFENEADNITREVLTAVRRTFITPFDRGDIQNLITAMDDAIDQMQQTAKAVILCEVREFEPTMREMGGLLVECAQLVGRALPLLQAIGANVSLLTRITEEVTKLEGRVDDLHDIGLKELFLKHRNANTMDFIVGAEIYDHLETVADRFDDVANETNSILIEQAKGRPCTVAATLGLPILVGLIAVALLFDFLNGLHDAANSIAPILSTRVLRPQYAVFWAAFFNFVAFLVFGLNVAQTIGVGIIEPSVIDF